MTKCDKCDGRGQIHSSPALAHEDQGCMFCDDCAQCHGSGQIGGIVAVVEVATPAVAEPPVVQPVEQQQDAPVQVLPALPAQVKLRKLTISDGNRPTPDADATKPTTQPPPLPRGRRVTVSKPQLADLSEDQAVSVTSPAPAPESQVATTPTSATSSVERPSTSNSRRSVARSVVSADSAKSAGKRKQSSFMSLSALSHSAATGEDEIVVASEEEAWVVRLAQTLQDQSAHVEVTVANNCYDVFDTTRDKIEGQQGYDTAVAMRQFGTLWAKTAPVSEVPVDTSPLKVAARLLPIPERHQLKAPIDNVSQSTLQFELDADKIVVKVISGSENDIIGHVLNPRKPDKVTLDQFLHVYRHFMTPDRLLDWLISYFKVVPAAVNTAAASAESPIGRSRKESVSNGTLSPGSPSPSNKRLSALTPSSPRGSNPSPLNKTTVATPPPTRAQDKEARRKKIEDDKERVKYMESTIPLIRANVIKVLLRWISQSWFEIMENPALLVKIDSFAQLLETGIPDFRGGKNAEPDIFYAECLQVRESVRNQNLKHQTLKMQQHTQLNEVMLRLKANFELPGDQLSNIRSHHKKFQFASEMKGEDLAQALTLLEWEQMSRVSDVALQLATLYFDGTCIVRDAGYYKSMPGHPYTILANYLQWQSLMTNWVTMSICVGETAKMRASVITNLIKVADLCHQMNNYAIMSAIVSGIMRLPITRLVTTLREVKRKHVATLIEMASLVDIDLLSDFKHFADYQTEYDAANAPKVPLLHSLIDRLRVAAKEVDKSGKYVQFGALADVAASIYSFAQTTLVKYTDGTAKMVAYTTPSSAPSRSGSVGASSIAGKRLQSVSATSSPLARLFGSSKPPAMTFTPSDMQAVAASSQMAHVRQAFTLLQANMPLSQNTDELKHAASCYSVLTQDASFARLVEMLPDTIKDK